MFFCATPFFLYLQSTLSILFFLNIKKTKKINYSSNYTALELFTSVMGFVFNLQKNNTLITCT
jgi:hypothetical protein